MIKNAFSKEPSERSNFAHPHRLHRTDIDRIAHDLGHKLEKKFSHLEEEAEEALGGGSHSRTESQSNLPERSHEMFAGEPTDGDAEDWPDSDEEDRKKPTKLSRPKIKLPGQKGVMGWFGKRDRSPSPNTAEEGRATMDPGLLSPPLSPTRPRPISQPGRSGIPLSRTASIPRNTAIRFAEGSQPSSESAPTPGNYGNANPGFQRNPALAMFRTSSVQEDKDEDGPSVSFKEPQRKK